MIVSLHNLSYQDISITPHAAYPITDLSISGLVHYGKLVRLAVWRTRGRDGNPLAPEYCTGLAEPLRR